MIIIPLLILPTFPHRQCNFFFGNMICINMLRHAINRGIATEGFGCIISGVFGTGNGATSFSENIGAIAITKAASRLVMQVAGVLLIVFSLCGKFSALFITMPDAVVGGLFCVMFGMITGVGLSNLKNCSMNSGRNLFIFGFSIFLGLALPRWMSKQIPTDLDFTRFKTLNQIISVMLSTAPFIGGITAAVLDNTIRVSTVLPSLIETDCNNDREVTKNEE